MTDRKWDDYHNKATTYPFCPGSLYREKADIADGRLGCRHCEYVIHLTTAASHGDMPNHDAVGTVRSYLKQRLGEARKLALWALLGCPRDEHQVGSVLTDLCLALTIQLEPSECFHPRLNPDGSCDDCNYYPATDDDDAGD